MKILLLSATQFEIAPFLQTTHPPLDILIGGVGIAATTFHLTKQLSHHHYDMVIQAGVAGTFPQQNKTENLELAEVVAVHQDAFGDLGAYEKSTFKSVQDMNLDNNVEWLHNPHWALHKILYKKVTGITVNTITDDTGIIHAMQKKWQAHVESMEGAALHYVCGQKQIPFIQLRAVSNVVGDRDKANWRMRDAIENLNVAIAETIATVSK
jgi:futalosine hydrolase